MGLLNGPRGIFPGRQRPWNGAPPFTTGAGIDRTKPLPSSATVRPWDMAIKSAWTDYVYVISDVAAAVDSVATVKETVAVVGDVATGVSVPVTVMDVANDVLDSVTSKPFENLQPYSEDPTQNTWTKYNVTVAFDSVTSDGVAVHKLSEMATSGVTHYLGTSSSYRQPLGTKTTTVAELKMGTRQYVAVSCALNVYVTFDLLNGTIAHTSNANITGSIEPHPRGDGWYICKVELTGTLFNPGYQPMALIHTMTGPTGWIFLGDVNEHVFVGRVHLYRHLVAPDSIYIKTSNLPIPAAVPLVVREQLASPSDVATSVDAASAELGAQNDVLDTAIAVDAASAISDGHSVGASTAVGVSGPFTVQDFVALLQDSALALDASVTERGSVVVINDSTVAITEGYATVDFVNVQADEAVGTSSVTHYVEGVGGLLHEILDEAHVEVSVTCVVGMAAVGQSVSTSLSSAVSIAGAAAAVSDVATGVDSVSTQRSSAVLVNEVGVVVDLSRTEGTFHHSAASVAMAVATSPTAIGVQHDVEDVATVIQSASASYGAVIAALEVLQAVDSVSTLRSSAVSVLEVIRGVDLAPTEVDMVAVLEDALAAVDAATGVVDHLAEASVQGLMQVAAAGAVDCVADVTSEVSSEDASFAVISQDANVRVLVRALTSVRTLLQKQTEVFPSLPPASPTGSAVTTTAPPATPNTPVGAGVQAPAPARAPQGSAVVTNPPPGRVRGGAKEE